MKYYSGEPDRLTDREWMLYYDPRDGEIALRVGNRVVFFDTYKPLFMPLPVRKLGWVAE